VFLRDPLERFLSAYVDKCTRRNARRAHCEPLEVFNSKANGLMEGIEGSKLAHFEAYVDAMPLRWNIHFFPLGLYCGGLSRTLGSYDFVGNLGEGFYRDLNVLGKRFGSRMADVLEDVFRRGENANESNVGTETRVPEHVKEYYSARTVRKVLQYFSIDYVKLSLKFPDWAREMLDEEGA